MNNPRLYHKAHEAQRYNAELFIKEYAHKLEWRNDGTDALMDIGCGCGDVLMDFIYTIMPAKFEKFVGSDISPKMINYAQELYGSNEKCNFKVLDIATDKNLPKDLTAQFNHVTSFYCLNWVQNKRQAFRNIFNLIKDEGGDCFLVFLAAHPIVEAYKQLSKSTKWSAYLNDIDRYLEPFHYIKGPKIEITNLLKEEGFSDVQVEIKHLEYTYEGLQNFKDNARAVSPYMDRIPISLHESFLDDYVDIIANFGVKQKNSTNEADYAFQCPSISVVVYAKKYPTNNSD